MSRVTLFGATYSVYVRIVRLALEELGVPYELVPIDIFEKASVPPDYRERHPFGRIPAFEHDGFRLFETDAIVAYIVETFGAGKLTPATITDRARMRQILRIMDHYAYPSLVWGIYVEELERGRSGQLRPDELERGRTCLCVLDDLAAPEFLVGTQISLADLWALPMLAYLDLAPSGRALLRDVPRCAAWQARMQARASVVATRFPAELKSA